MKYHIDKSCSAYSTTVQLLFYMAMLLLFTLRRTMIFSQLSIIVPDYSCVFLTNFSNLEFLDSIIRSKFCALFSRQLSSPYLIVTVCGSFLIAFRSIWRASMVVTEVMLCLPVHFGLHHGFSFC